MELYEPPVSLWEVIEANTGAVELDEMRLILGPGDVDLSVDLRQEVNSLLDVWRSLHDERTCKPLNQLGDQTELRRRLVSEIKLFVDSIKENPDMIGVFRVENLSSRPIVKLALAEFDRSFLRASSSIGSDGRETPTYLPSPPRSTPSRASSQVSMEDIVQMKDKLKIDRVMEIIQHLKSYLQKEIAQLKDDVVYLRNCIEEDNAMLNAHYAGEQLTVAELKNERNQVEAEVRWATENAALLRPVPPKSKRYGSLTPLDDSSRPSSSVSVAQTLSSMSPPPSPKSPVDAAIVSSSKQQITVGLKPYPPSEMKNIRVISGKIRQPAISKSLSHEVTPLDESGAASTKSVTANVSASHLVRNSRPPLPPTAAKTRIALKVSTCDK